MENKSLNEKESLELITRMIQNSKKNLELGSGNIFVVGDGGCGGAAGVADG